MTPDLITGPVISLTPCSRSPAAEPDRNQRFELSLQTHPGSTETRAVSHQRGRKNPEGISGSRRLAHCQHPEDLPLPPTLPAGSCQRTQGAQHNKNHQSHPLNTCLPSPNTKTSSLSFPLKSSQQFCNISIFEQRTSRLSLLPTPLQLLTLHIF